MAQQPERVGEGLYRVPGGIQWRIEIKGRTHTGVEPTIPAAKKARTAKATERDTNVRQVQRNNVTVAEQVELYIASLQDKADRTIRHYRNRARLYLGPIADRPIQSLDIDEMERWLAEMTGPRRKAGVSVRTNARSLVQAALDKAVKHGKLAVNPLTLVDRPKQPKPAVFAADRGDVGRMIAGFPEHYRIALYLALEAGLRRGEVCGLRIDAIDWEVGELAIVRQWDGTLPKGGKTRTVPVDESLLNRLRAHLLRQGGPGADGIVLSGRRHGRAIDPSQLDSIWREVRAEIGSDLKGIHQLRHAFASWHLANGEPLADVAAWMGDTEETVLRYYVHPTRGRRPRTSLTALAEQAADGFPHGSLMAAASDGLATVSDLGKRRNSR
jgi:integrase